MSRSVRTWRAGVLAVLCLGGTPGPAAAADDSLQALVQRLWIQASDGAVRHRDLVGPSKDSLNAMGRAAVPYLLPYLHTEDARERHTITDIFQGMDSIAVEPLVAVLGTGGEYHTGNTLWALGKIGHPSATPGMIPFLSDSMSSVRDKAAEAIGKCGGSRAAEALYTVLHDEHESVRKSAVVGLGRLQDTAAADSLVAALNDEWFGVRYASAFALVAIDSGRTASGRVHGMDGRPLALLAGALSRQSGAWARTACRELLDHPDYRVRAAALRGWLDLPELAADDRPPLTRRLESETHPLVRHYLQRLLSQQP